MMFERYSFMHSGFSTIAKINVTAKSCKACCGATAYKLAAVREFTRLTAERFDLYLDDKLAVKDLETTSVIVNNGKIMGGPIFISPMAVINDGLMEVVYIPGRTSFGR